MCDVILHIILSCYFLFPFSNIPSMSDSCFIPARTSHHQPQTTTLGNVIFILTPPIIASAPQYKANFQIGGEIRTYWCDASLPQIVFQRNNYTSLSVKR
jgi:hypothetical protein